MKKVVRIRIQKRRGRKPGVAFYTPKNFVEHGALVWALVSADMCKIMRQCGAPNSWCESDAAFLFHSLAFPNSLNAAKFNIDRTGMKMAGPGERQINALRFGAMFAESPVALIKILQRMDRKFSALCRSPKFQVALLIAGDDTPAEKMLPKVKSCFASCEGVGITKKIIEHARAFLRQRKISP